MQIGREVIREVSYIWMNIIPMIYVWTNFMCVVDNDGTFGGTSATCSGWDGQCQSLINQLVIDSNGITPLGITSYGL